MRSNLLAAAVVPIAVCVLLCVAAVAEPVPVKHVQVANHGVMVARAEDGKPIARFDFVQSVQGSEVTMHLTYRFQDGSMDEETTTFTQQGVFRLVRSHHVQKGPFFSKPVDFTVDAASGTATTSTTDKNGKIHVDTERMRLPDDLSNGFIGTLLLNVPPNTAPFRVGILAPVVGGRLVRLLVSPEGERPFQMAGQTRKATVFRIHPELGGIVGVIAQLLGLQPKDVMVWVLEGEAPAIVRTVGQLGGSGPVVSSELEGTSFEK